MLLRFEIEKHETSSGLKVLKQDNVTKLIKFFFLINLSKFQIFLWYVCYLVIFLYVINVIVTNQNCHCVKSAQLRSYRHRHRQEINCFYWVKSIWPASKDIFEVWNKDTSRTIKTSSGLVVSKQDTRTISIKFAFFINLSKFQVFLWYVCYLVIFLYDINVIATNQNCHCVKSVQLRSYFWSIFPCIRTEYRDLLRKSPCLILIQENTDQKKRRIWTLFT